MKTVITDLSKFEDRADEVINLKKENNEVREIILDLKKLLRDNDWVCLTAPQIGVNKRIMCLNYLTFLLVNRY